MTKKITKKPTCSCIECKCGNEKASKDERISKLLETYSETLNGLWDNVERVRGELNNFENAVTDVQNDYDMLFDDIQFILNS
jgi:hypothetical protein